MLKVDNLYDTRYAGQDYYWGHKPSAMCDRVLQLVTSPAAAPLRLLDLGCGEGRNAVYFAQHGFQVVGLDASLPGLEKTRRYAAERGVPVGTVAANIVTHDLVGPYDVIFSTGALQYLPPALRERRFQQYKEATAPGGLNAMSVFVFKPFIPRAPDGESTSHRYRSGELLGYYWDWEVLYCTEEIFDCMSGGIAHQHATDRVIARKR